MPTVQDHCVGPLCRTTVLIPKTVRNSRILVTLYAMLALCHSRVGVWFHHSQLGTCMAIISMTT